MTWSYANDAGPRIESGLALSRRPRSCMAPLDLGPQGRAQTVTGSLDPAPQRLCPLVDMSDAYASSSSNWQPWRSGRSWMTVPSLCRARPVRAAT